tara:strand:+ start:17 stop:907 length:891 start_codon:yes stop_codon:yes gene_type:complete
MSLVKNDLSRAMLTVAPIGRAPVLAAVAATVLQLYMVMHLELKMQLEAFLRMSLLPLADVKPVTELDATPTPTTAGLGSQTGHSDLRRVALECLVDLCRQPNFVPDLYVNFDCDVRRPNLFEELVGLLSRGATPGQGTGLSDENLLSLEGLLAITGGVADRSATAAAAMRDETAVTFDNATNAPMSVDDFWGTMRDGNGGVAGAVAAQTAGPGRARFLRRNRHLKRRLLACADHFNAKPKKGLAYMQDIGVLTAPLCATQVAAFLKHAPGLDKAVAGEYLGDHHEFNVSVLGEYVR